MERMRENQRRRVCFVEFARVAAPGVKSAVSDYILLMTCDDDDDDDDIGNVNLVKLVLGRSRDRAECGRHDSETVELFVKVSDRRPPRRRGCFQLSTAIIECRAADIGDWMR